MGEMGVGRGGGEERRGGEGEEGRGGGKGGGGGGGGGERERAFLKKGIRFRSYLNYSRHSDIIPLYFTFREQSSLTTMLLGFRSYTNQR